MIDLSTETPIPLAEACRLIPPARSGRRTHISTLVRWITHGAPGPQGERIRLEALRLGDRWVTTRQAIQRFAERLTPPASDDQVSPPPRTPTARRRSHERAARTVESAGI
jgi:hypothetical protein